MLTVWGRRNSLNVQKVMWAIGELGLTVDRRDVGGTFGAVNTPDYLAMNPNGRIPTLEDNGLVLWESNAVVRYLAAKHGEGSLWPDQPTERALADQWMDWMQTTLIPALTTIFVGLTWQSPEERDVVDIASATEAVGQLWGHLEAHLEGRQYIAGESLTMGDIPLGAACFRYHYLAIERPSLPNVERWYERLSERPAFQQHVMIPFGRSLAEWQELEQAGAGK